MTITSIYKKTWAALTVLMTVSAVAIPLLAGSPPTPKQVSIEIVGAKKDVIPRVTLDGWPLTLRIAANSPMGIFRGGAQTWGFRYGGYAQTSYILFSDPDESTTTTLPGCYPGSDPLLCPHLTYDELYVEYTPLLNPSATFENGSPAAPNYDPMNGNPYLLAAGIADWGCPDDYPDGNGGIPGDCLAGNIYPVPVGPEDPAYGRSDSLPGLVVLANIGSALVFDDGFEYSVPLKARNLAGFMNSVSSVLNDKVVSKNVPEGRSVIEAQMNVPRGLFSPIVRMDTRYDDDVTPCVSLPASAVRYVIDAGEPIQGFNDVLDSLNAATVTIRVFMVNGNAPSVLADVNGDNKVDWKDAKLMGYTLLSDEEVYQIKGMHGLDGFPEGEPHYEWIKYDLDANGVCPTVAPAGAGRLSSIPD